MSLHPLRGDRRVQVSALALMSSLAMTSPVMAKQVVNDKESTISRSNSGCYGDAVDSALCAASADEDRVINSGTINLDLPTSGNVDGIYIGSKATAPSISIINDASASISVTAKRAYGIGVRPYATETVSVVNNGTITVVSSAVVWYTGAGASGMDASMDHNAENTVSMLNNGRIFSSSSGPNAPAYGMSMIANTAVGGYTSNNYGYLTNAGLIDVAAAGNKMLAIGMSSTLDGSGNTSVLSNTGTITATASGAGGGAYGIRASVGKDSVATVSSTGIVRVAGDNANELYVTSDFPVYGSGAVNVAAWNLSLDSAGNANNQKVFKVDNGTTMNFDQTHLVLRSGGEHSSAKVVDFVYRVSGGAPVDNGNVVGVIGAVSTDDPAYQATLEGYGSYLDQTVYRDRAEQENSKGNTLTATTCATVSCGLYSSTQGLGLSNAGTLDISGTGPVQTGMYANLRTLAGINSAAVSLDNTGTINVDADPAMGAAYGMYVRLQDAAQVANINSSGEVNVSGATAHQVFVTGQPGVGGGTANLKHWNLNLEDRTPGSQSVFAVADGATLNFSNTHLILRPGSVDKGYADGKQFSVADMVQNYGNGAQVEGQIGSVSTPVNFLKASHGRVDEAGADRWDNQWVSLDVHAEDSDGQLAEVGAVDNMQSQIDRVGNLLVGGYGSGGVAFGDGDVTSVQMRVYYGNQQRRGTGAAVTDSTGAVVFGDYDVGEGHTLGWHAGLEYANLRAKSKTLNINSISAIFGGQGRYNFSDAVYLRGQVSGIVSNNNNHFNTREGDSAKATTINTGLYGAVFGGYDYKLDEHNSITPEVGLSTLWSHTPSMGVKYDRNPDLNQSYAAQNYTGVYANASVRWTGGIDIDGTLLRPTVMAGVRQTLGDGKVKSAMAFDGNRFNSSITRDRTVGIVDVGVSSTVSTSFDVGLNYRGEYSSNTTNHIGYLNATIRF